MWHFPYYKQHDSVQCGIACLKMVCKFFGREYSFNSLSKLCTATTEGVSMLSLRKATTNLGLHSKCVQTSMEDLKRHTHPCILHWNQNHFVVLYKFYKDCFYVADPSNGLVKHNIKDFRKHWISTEVKLPF